MLGVNFDNIFDSADIVIYRLNVVRKWGWYNDRLSKLVPTTVKIQNTKRSAISSCLIIDT